MLQSRLSRPPDFGMYRQTDWGVERSLGLLSNGSATGCGGSAAVPIRPLDGSRHQRIDPKKVEQSGYDQQKRRRK